MNGPFTVLEFPDPQDPHIVYLDVLTTSYYLNDLREVGPTSSHTIGYAPWRSGRTIPGV